MMDEQLNKAFDSVSIPEFSEQKRQNTIHQAEQKFAQTADLTQESHEPQRPMINSQSKWTMLWRQIMDKTNNYGGMVAASLIAITVGYGVFQTTSFKTVQIPQAQEGEFKTAIEVIEGQVTKESMAKVLKDESMYKAEELEANIPTRGTSASTISKARTKKDESRKWIDGTEESETYLSRAVPQEEQLSEAAATYIEQNAGLSELYLPEPQSRNQFTGFDSNPVKQTIKEPISTFSIDTDTASYSFIRRQLLAGETPGADAVRVEEMINYFDYDYSISADVNVPFTTTTQVVSSPWNENNKLIHIGIKAFEQQSAEKPKSNLVFLIDTSGSMRSEDKLHLLINSLRLLVNTLDSDDTVSIVTYAGSAGTVLEPTSVKDKNKIINALDHLAAGGSTAGHAGIEQAYALAEQHYDKEAVNRIFLATDGDFNVGINDPDKLKDYIADKRKSGVFLSILGFGDGNYNDHLMQTLAQNGNGQAFYIDTLNEAQKVLVDEASSTLFPVAKDVKIQIEFNPDVVAEYRLIGYETRALNTEDFNNDKIDAGEIGAGHAVTAIYEITPADSKHKMVDQPRYEANNSQVPSTSEFKDEYAFLKIRYKQPNADQSEKITTPITVDDEISNYHKASQDIRFAIAVAAFGQLLKDSAYTDEMNFDDVLKLAQSAKGNDPYGYRSEFIQLVKLAKSSRP